MDVSVIVPVYNIENYLRKCIESLLDQETDCNYEIILVDDGSTDNSGKICDEYAEECSNITVYHTENRGLSEARNYGIDRSHGKYLTFVDSDDHVGKRYIQIMYTSLIRHTNAQIATIGVVSVTENQKIDNKGQTRLLQSKVVNKIDGLSRMFARRGMGGVSAWAKMYHRELFNDIRFPKGKLYEDMLTVPYLFEKSENIIINFEVEYFYLTRSESISQRKVTEKDYMIFEGLDTVGEYFENNYPILKKDIQSRNITDSLGIVNRLAFEGGRNKDINRVKGYIKKYSAGFVKNNHIKPRTKLQLIVLNISSTLYSLIIRIILSNR